MVFNGRMTDKFEGFERKLSCQNKALIPLLSWKYRKPMKNSGRIANILDIFELRPS
jgi:hypothetical protein